MLMNYQALDIKTHIFIFKFIKKNKHWLLFFLACYNLLSLAYDSEFQLEYDSNENFFFVEKVGLSDFTASSSVKKNTNTISEFSLNSLSIAEKKLYLNFQVLSQVDINPIKLATVSADILNYFFFGNPSNCVITAPTTTAATYSPTDTVVNSVPSFQLATHTPSFSFSCFGGAGFGGDAPPPPNLRHTRDKNCPMCSGGVCVKSTFRQSVICQCYQQGFSDGLQRKQRSEGISSAPSLEPQFNYGGAFSSSSLNPQYSSVGALAGTLHGMSLNPQYNSAVSLHGLSLNPQYNSAVSLHGLSQNPQYNSAGTVPGSSQNPQYNSAGTLPGSSLNPQYGYKEISTNPTPVIYESSKRKLTQCDWPPLEKLFATNHFPKRQDKMNCAAMTGLTYVQVCTWLANKRRREKRDAIRRASRRN